MSSSEWDEVKRLAADFQRAQLTESVQRLSERNCVELIMKLKQHELISLYHSCDGLTYVTAAHLRTEMINEVHANRGRLSLVDLAEALNMDYEVIKKEVAAVLEDASAGLQLVQNELVSAEYQQNICVEVGHKLAQLGRLTVDSLTAEYHLPGDFIRKIVQQSLIKSGAAVTVSCEPGVMYTRAYLSRIRARVLGTMGACVRPTPLSALASKHQYHNSIFISTVEGFIRSGRLSGELSGVRYTQGYTFTPELYINALHRAVTNFWASNGYLEYCFLQRLGIEDPRSFISSTFEGKTELLFLSDVCVGGRILGQVRAALEDALASNSYIDASMTLPSSFSPEACVAVLRKVTAETPHGSKCIILGDSFVMSEVLTTQVQQRLSQVVMDAAHALVASGDYAHQQNKEASEASSCQSDSRKEDKKKTKAGHGASNNRQKSGGSQGREVRTKSVKSKGGKKSSKQNEQPKEGEAEDDSNDVQLQFSSLEELQSLVSSMEALEDCDPTMVEQLVEHLTPWCNQEFSSWCRKYWTSLTSSEAETKKATMTLLVDKIGALALALTLGEQATQEFGENSGQLVKYLLKTKGAELVAAFVEYFTDGKYPSEKLENAQKRSAVIAAMIDNAPHKALLVAANAGLVDAEACATIGAVETLLPLVGVLPPKKKDKSRERQFMLTHRENLLTQLEASVDAALTLHIAALLLCDFLHGTCMQASGKFVPLIIKKISPQLTVDLRRLVSEYQGLVMEKLTTKDDTAYINSQLELLTPTLKDDVNNYLLSK